MYLKISESQLTFFEHFYQIDPAYCTVLPGWRAVEDPPGPHVNESQRVESWKKTSRLLYFSIVSRGIYFDKIL